MQMPANGSEGELKQEITDEEEEGFVVLGGTTDFGGCCCGTIGSIALVLIRSEEGIGQSNFPKLWTIAGFPTTEGFCLSSLVW